MFKRLWQATVWAPNGVPAAAWRFRGIFRLVLPLTDVFFLYFGTVSWWTGVSAVRAATGHEYAAWWSASVALAALGALVGVAFPKLWALELAAKIALVGLIFGYVALFAVRIVTDFHTSASAGLVLILILLPLWRVGDLGFVAWTRGHQLGGKR